MNLKSIPHDAMSYQAYVALVEKLLQQNLSTGHVQSEAYLEYSKLNLQRMRRIEKTVHLTEETKAALHLIQKPVTWLVLTEGWCGDAAQNLPVIELMTRENKNIRLEIILRDDHGDIMDNYLTAGARSIPKLICLDNDALQERFNWGPRPAELQDLILKLKDDGVAKEERSLAAQNWYNKDKGQSLQNEFINLVRNL